MKRYNITIESRFNNQRRIKITSADNGEWVRYEDVAEALEQAQELQRVTADTVSQQDDLLNMHSERIEQLEATMKELLIAGAALWNSVSEQTPKNYGGTNG